jgi:hypothetical protein
MSRISRRNFMAATASAGAFWNAGCVDSLKVDRFGWPAGRGTEYVLPRSFHAPTSAKQLSDVVAEAGRTSRRVRLTGSGLSFSDVALCDDWLLSPQRLTQIFASVDRSQIRPEAETGRLVRLQTGVRIRELNAELDRRGLALTNMGGWDEQTLVGAAMTGTHGSGLEFGPIESQLRSIQLVGPGGRLLQVEPTGGITNPAAFRGRLDEDSSLRVELVQDDDLFRAVAVSLGCLGLVYAVVLEAVEKFWIIERRTLTTWEDLAAPTGDFWRLLRGEAVTGSDLGKPDHFEVFYTPYADAGGKHSALLTQRWRRRPEPPVGGTNHQGSIWYSLVTAAGLAADRAHHLEPIVAHFDRGQMLAFHRTALSQLAEERYVNVSYGVFNVGRPNELMVYGVEMAFDVSQAKEAVERSFSLANELADEGLLQTAPVSLRFVAPSNAHLAMQQGRTTMTMEVPMAIGIPGAEEILWRYELEFMRNMGARPHWGLDRNVIRDAQTVRHLYPKWDKWLEAYRRLNPVGTFDGRLTDRLGISRRA